MIYMGLFYFSDLQEIAGVSADTAVMEKEKEKNHVIIFKGIFYRIYRRDGR